MRCGPATSAMGVARTGAGNRIARELTGSGHGRSEGGNRGVHLFSRHVSAYDDGRRGDAHRPLGGIGRRDGLKIHCPKGRIGSTPIEASDSRFKKGLKSKTARLRQAGRGDLASYSIVDKACCSRRRAGGALARGDAAAAASHWGGGRAPPGSAYQRWARARPTGYSASSGASGVSAAFLTSSSPLLARTSCRICCVRSLFSNRKFLEFSRPWPRRVPL